MRRSGKILTSSLPNRDSPDDKTQTPVVKSEGLRVVTVTENVLDGEGLS